MLLSIKEFNSGGRKKGKKISRLNNGVKKETKTDSSRKLFVYICK